MGPDEALRAAIRGGGGRLAELIYADRLDETGRSAEASLIRADRPLPAFPPAVAGTVQARWDGGFPFWSSGGYGGDGGDGGDGGYGGYGGAGY